MKKIFSVLISLIMITGSFSNAFAMRNEERRRLEEEQKKEENIGKEEKSPDLSEELCAKLDGCLIFKNGSKIRFESGKSVQGDAEAYLKDGNMYIPAAVSATFFGSAAVWDQENSRVSIDGKVVYPTDQSEIKDGRTMISADGITKFISAKVLYSENDAVILGKNDISQETLEEVKAAIRDTFYVVPDTSVQGDGSLENPFGGFETAVSQIRELTKNGMTSNIKVYLRGGRYLVDNAVNLTESDSGKNGFTITYESYPGEQAEISATHEVTGWTKYKDGIYMAKVDAKQEICMLYENEQTAVKARYPNMDWEGWTKDPSKYQLKIYDEDKENRDTQFYFSSEDKIPYVKNPNQLQCAYYAADYTHQIINCKIDYRSKRITLANRASWYPAEKDKRYYLQGSLDLLDYPGEYYHDTSSNTIYYMPFNDDIEKQTILYATDNSMLNMTGTNDVIKNIQFKNIVFGGCNMVSTFGEEYNLGAINLKNAENCGFDECEFNGCGGCAVVIWDSKKCFVKNSYLHNIGCNGVSLRGSYDDGIVREGGNIIENNYFYNIGAIKRDTAGIMIKGSDNNKIIYNTIEFVSRNAIWGGTGFGATRKKGQTINGTLITEENMYDFKNFRGNLIAYNDIYNCMTDSSDGGPIYIWGTGKDNVIKNNHVNEYDILYGFGYALYGDDQTGYTTWENNIVDHINLHGTGRLNAMIITKAMDHKVINNFFIDGNPQKGAYSTETKLNDSHDNITYTRNLTMNCSDQLHGQWKWYDDRFKLCNYNFYYNDSGKYLIYNNTKAKTLEDWKKINTDNGYMDTASISGENPSFVDYDNRDYRFKYDTKAYSIGIQDIDEKNIGVKEDFKYADKDDELKKLYLETDTDGLNANVRLNTGATARVSVTARTEKGFFADLQNSKITYSSSDESVARVSDNGIITAASNGIAEISVTAEKNEKTVSSKLYVLVGDSFETLHAEAAEKVIDKGKTTDIIASAKSSMGFYLPISSFEYKSSNESVISVDENGKVTGNAPGKATVTVTGTYHGISKSAVAEITVLDGVLDNITLTADKPDPIVIGDKINLSFEAKLTNGREVRASEVIASYESGDENIIKVDENGVASAVGEGRVMVTVYLEKDGFRKSQSISLAVFDKYSGKLGDGFKEVNFGESHGYADFLDDGKIKLRATGKDFWGAADDGYYLYKDVNASSIEMNIESLYMCSSNTSVGIQMRAAATPESRNVGIRCTATGNMVIVWRAEDGGGYEYQTVTSVAFPVGMKLEKAGNTITVYANYGKGAGYEFLKTIEMNLGASPTAGVNVFAQSTDGTSTEGIINGLKIEESVN